MKHRNPPKRFYRTVEFRANGDGDGFAGYASTFNAVDSWGTFIVQGAFKRTLNARSEDPEKRRITLLWQHLPSVPMGRTKKIDEDDTGLYFDALVDTDTQAGAEAMSLLRKETDLRMSFGFDILRWRSIEESDYPKLKWDSASEWYKTDEGRKYVRGIEELKLWEISLVTFASNEDAELSEIRSYDSESLSSFLEDIRAGTLDERSQALAVQIAEAINAPGSERSETPPPPPTAVDVRSQIAALDFELAMMELVA